MQKNHPVTRANGTAINTDQRWLVQLHDRGRELYVERRHGGCGVRGTELGGYWCECSEQQEPCCDPHDHPSGTGLGNSRQLFRDVRHASLRLLVTGKGILEGKRELAKEISTFDKTSFLVRTQASALASVAAAPSALLGRRSYLSRSSRTPPTRRHCCSCHCCSCHRWLGPGPALAGCTGSSQPAWTAAPRGPASPNLPLVSAT